MAWDQKAAEMAQEAAASEFDAWFEGLSESEQQVVRQLVAWWRKWFNGNGDFHATGHKDLARYLLANVKNP